MPGRCVDALPFRTGLPPRGVFRLHDIKPPLLSDRLLPPEVPRKGPRSPGGGLVVRTPSIGGAENGAYFSYSH